MFESSEYLLWPIDSNWTFYITQPQFLPTQLIRAYSTIYMLFLYAANILSAGVALFRKKINFTFIPNLFVFGTMLYLLIFENAPRRAMIAVPFMIYNVIFYCHNGVASRTVLNWRSAFACASIKTEFWFYIVTGAGLL